MRHAASDLQVQREASRPGSGTDIQRVSQHITRLGVAGLPRNYELLHEAIIGQNAALAQDIAALGSAPNQAALDDLGLKYRLVSHCGMIDNASQAEAVKLLRETAGHVADCLIHRRAFTRAAETVLNSIVGDPEQSLSSLMNEMEYLSQALEEATSGEAALQTKLQADLERLETLARGVAAAQVASTTDKLTGLPNRIALNRAIADLYERDEGFAGSALIMVDIDDFRGFNSRYGTHTGSRLLKKLADIFRKSIKKNDVVARTDGDEFSFLFANVGMQEAGVIAERLRTSAEDNLVFATSDNIAPARLTISLGIALSADATTASQLQANARVALYAAQSNRRQPIQAFGR